MYVFTSAFFFIIFFSIYDPSNLVSDSNQSDKKNPDTAANSNAARQAAIAKALEFAHTKEDSAEILEGTAVFTDTIPIDPSDTAKKGWTVKMSTDTGDYKSVAEYDSIQRSLPPDKRHGFLRRVLNRRQIVIRNKYGDDERALMRAWINHFIHQFPKLLFVSLPIFAFILWLLYIRRRKQYYYVNHGIFSIHLYIFSFILLLVSMGITGLVNATGWDWINWLQLPLWLYWLYYLYKAMRVFYQQGRTKTVVKFLLLNVLATTVILFLFLVFFLVTVFQI